MDLHQSQKLDILSKITRDPIFSHSNVYVKLLNYLFNCSLDGSNPSEIDIAIKVFDKKNHYDPSVDNYVRVYMYKLRKKLDQYYAGPGKHDAIKVYIPKGHYNLQFVAKSKSKITQASKSIRINIAFSLIALMCLALALYFWTRYQNWESKMSPFQVKKDNFVWSEYFNSGLPTLVVFGHVFAFRKYNETTQNYELVHNSDINSDDELEAFIDRHSLNPGHYAIGGWKILPASEVMNFARIQLLLFCGQQNFDIEISSQLTWNDIRNKNIIFVSHFKNLGILEHIIPDKYFHFSSDKINNEGEVQAHINGEQYQYEFVNNFRKDSYQGYAKDFVLLTKLPGPRNNTLLTITSFHHIGRREAVKILTNPTSIKELTNQISLPSAYFQLLLRVEGYERTAMNCNVEHLVPLEPDFKMSQTFPVVSE